jgi:hypothetical protein
LSLELVVAARQLVEGKVASAARTATRSLSGTIGQAARRQRDLEEVVTDPERIIRRYGFKLLARFMPAPVWRVLSVAHALGLFRPREN